MFLTSMTLGMGFAQLSFAGDEFCVDLFLNSPVPTQQCSDADYFVDKGGGGVNFGSFAGNDAGLLTAEFDGYTIFAVDEDPQDFLPPRNVGVPFFSTAGMTIVTDANGNVIEFRLDHKGSVSLGSREDSVFQSAAYGNRSHVTIVPINMGDPDAPLLLDVEIDFDFTLRDPLDNATMGAALGGIGVKVTDANKVPANQGDPVEPEIDFSVVGELNIKNPEEPNPDVDLDFFGLDDPDLEDGFIEIDFTPSEPEIDDEFDIEIEIELELDLSDFEIDAELGGPKVQLEVDTFGSIFTDGFESGDTSAWSMSSPDTMKMTVTSPDPNVRFILVGVDEIPSPSPGLPELAVLPRTDGQPGKVALQFESEQGRDYVIESSADLMTFTALATIAGTGDMVEFVDLESQGKSQMYYRLSNP